MSEINTMPYNRDAEMALLGCILIDNEIAIDLVEKLLAFLGLQGIAARLYERVVDHMLDIGLEDGFVQELSSSDEKYIPSFDLTGVPGAEE